MRDANGNKLGRGALSVDQLKALKSAKEDAHRQRVLATRQREHATEEHQLALKRSTSDKMRNAPAPPSPRKPWVRRKCATSAGRRPSRNQKEPWPWNSRRKKCHQKA